MGQEGTMRERRLRLSETAKQFWVLIPIISTNFRPNRFAARTEIAVADGCEDSREPKCSEQRGADGSERGTHGSETVCSSGG